MKKLNKVISCFAGLGCGELALKRCGIETDTIYAYEIDKYAEAVNRYHNPNTYFLGDITQWKSHRGLIGGGNIDLIMGGSPCQDLSIAGKRAGLKGARSSLVYVFADMVKYYKPKYFFLENVTSMTKTDRDTITGLMGVEPLEINSADVSAQSRRRLYWTNIPYITLYPNSLLIENILEPAPAGSLYYEKSRVSLKSKAASSGLVIKTGNIDNRNSQGYRVYDVRGKFPALDTRGDRIKILLDDGRARSLSIVEFERAFTLPDNYTSTGIDKSGIEFNISKTRRYRMTGNGWVVKTIEQFFKSLGG